jgi:hypothetical protein
MRGKGLLATEEESTVAARTPGHIHVRIAVTLMIFDPTQARCPICRGTGSVVTYGDVPGGLSQDDLCDRCGGRGFTIGSIVLCFLAPAGDSGETVT